ncbi:MAG: hypothetical protein QG632_132 [Candidatus Dependentiae bacterium]|nr:hypothetical protein [Candidatus Dependentiae bacterium]
MVFIRWYLLFLVFFLAGDAKVQGVDTGSDASLSLAVGICACCIKLIPHAYNCAHASCKKNNYISMDTEKISLVKFDSKKLKY